MQRSVYTPALMGRPKPPISAWIVSGRKAKGWKPADLAAALRERGVRCEEGTVRTWEAGRKPADDAIAEMERVFGVQAPADEAPVTDFSAVVAAMAEQTAAIREQTAAILKLVATRDELADLRVHVDQIAEEWQAGLAEGQREFVRAMAAEGFLATPQTPPGQSDAEPDPAPKRRPVANGGGK